VIPRSIRKAAYGALHKVFLLIVYAGLVAIAISKIFEMFTWPSWQTLLVLALTMIGGLRGLVRELS